jgi:hypothetical protein
VEKLGWKHYGRFSLHNGDKTSDNTRNAMSDRTGDSSARTTTIRDALIHHIEKLGRKVRLVAMLVGGLPVNLGTDDWPDT